MPTNQQDFSPITLSVVSGTLDNTIREMSEIIIQTARSVVIAIGRDFSTTLLGHLDGIPIMVAQGDDQPIHLGDLILKVKEGARYFGVTETRGELAPGDVIFQNDPESGGNHLPDISMYKPIFVGDELVAWSAVTCHIPEVGGPVPGAFNPDADTIFAEGIRIPHVKIVDGGKPREDVWNFIVANVRTPDSMRGDMGAMLSAINRGEKRIQNLCEKYGVETVRGCMKRLVQRAEVASRAEIASLPDGIYTGTAIMDGDEREVMSVRISLDLEVRGDEIYMRFESPPQTKSDINAYKNNSLSAVYFAYIAALPPGSPMNEGLYAPLHIDLGPMGTVINAQFPAACYTSTGPTFGLVLDAVNDALSKANPERAAAKWSFVNVTTFNGIDPRDNEPFAYLSHFASEGGGPAYYGRDGGHMWGCDSTAGAHSTGDVELVEFRAPLHINKYELLPDSGSPGKWRGGLGSVMDVSIECDDCVITITGGGYRFAPASRLGGGSANDQILRLNKKWAKRKNGIIEELPLRTVTKLHQGEYLLGELQGGGAVGPAYERDLFAIEYDVINGLVTLEKAREEYGVVFEEGTFTIDVGATQVLRKTLSNRAESQI